MNVLKSIRHPEFTVVGALLALAGLGLIVAHFAVSGDEHGLSAFVMPATGLYLLVTGGLLVKKNNWGTAFYLLLIGGLVIGTLLDQLPHDSWSWGKFLLKLVVASYFAYRQIHYHRNHTS